MSVETRVHRIETPASGRLLVRAPASGSPAGVLTGFHGYAESAEMQLDRMAALAAADNWLLLSIQGLNRFYRGRSEDIVAGWMTRQDREVAIALNIIYVDRAVDWLRQEFTLNLAESVAVDSNGTLPLVCCGFSQGTAMAFRAAVRGRWRSSGVIAVGGDVPPELLAGADARFPPVLLARGARDEWYTQEKLDADVAALTARGTRVTPLVFDGGHEWAPGIAEPVSQFIETVERQLQP